MKRRRTEVAVLLLVCGFLSCTSNSKAQKNVQKWEYLSSYGKPYYLERTWLSDSIYSDKYFFDKSEMFWQDTFYIKSNTSYFKRGDKYYAYLSQKAFENGDTIRYYYQEAVNPSGSLFMVREFMFPDKDMKENGLLVYKLVSPEDDPKHSSSKLYYDPKRNLITKIITVEGTRILNEK